MIMTDYSQRKQFLKNKSLSFNIQMFLIALTILFLFFSALLVYEPNTGKYYWFIIGLLLL